MDVITAILGVYSAVTSMMGVTEPKAAPSTARTATIS